MKVLLLLSILLAKAAFGDDFEDEIHSRSGFFPALDPIFVHESINQGAGVHGAAPGVIYPLPSVQQVPVAINFPQHHFVAPPNFVLRGLLPSASKATTRFVSTPFRGFNYVVSRAS